MVTGSFDAIIDQILDSIKHQMMSRAYRAANEMRNEAIDNVLKGQRSGRVYRVPMTKVKYTASAPGEPPANRTGMFRLAWHPTAKAETVGANFTVTSQIENSVTIPNGQLLGEILEHGSPGGKIAPRPHHERIQKAALPAIKRIYEEPYF